MPEVTPHAPAVHVALIEPEVEALERWISFGAEEEGVPTRAVAPEATDPVAAAYAAARSSSFGIGLAIGRGRIVLHETHMPAEHPVLDDRLGDRPERIARRYGSNAARLVVRLPLRLVDEVEPEAPAPAPRRAVASTATATATVSDEDEVVRRLVGEIVGRLKVRGAIP
jgi:hypothetical protein